MKTAPKTQQENRMFALHYKGKLLGTFQWTDGGPSYLQGWRPPKKVYFTRKLAKSGASHLPVEILDDIEMVEYVPVKVVHKFSTQERKNYILKKDVESKQRQIEYDKKYNLGRISTLEKELGELKSKIL